jgi:class 3 adenylate cyclase/tetratricopeptide (TPR) repeat protein
MAREGERKQVSVLFCDIADSTRLADAIGADRMHGVVNEFFEDALTEIRRFEGTINVFLGDGFMALFGEPVAHEDHARRAALAGLAIQDMLTRRTSAFLPAGTRLEARIGINSGAVVVGRIGDSLRWDYTAIGDTTNVAARLQAEADPGTIVCSEAVAHAVERHVECIPVGTRELKGKPEPVPVYRIVRAMSARVTDSALVIPIIGRPETVAGLRARVDDVAAGAGGIAAVVGEAGMGKSRLLADARRYAGERGVRWLEGASLSFGGTLSYWPFRDLVRAAFAITEDDDDRQSWTKLRSRMTELFGSEQGEELVPYIGVLLSLPVPEDLAVRTRALDGLSMGHQIFRSTLKLVERLGQERPTAIVFEDWHWADASSADLLEHLLPLALAVPVLFIVASRPGSQGPWAKLRSAVTADQRLMPPFQELALTPLAEDDASALVTLLLGGGSLPAAVRQPLLRRAVGNPFFLSELIRALRATRAIERDAGTGAWTATDQFDPSLLPDSVEGVLLARIDRLEDEAKQVLKIAAVIGRSFFYRVLGAIVEGADTLDADLARLVAAEFIDQKQALPELEYVFKHPLIQHASYRSLLAERRRLLHRRVGETIERLFDTRLEEFYSVLAYHYAQAEHWPKAQEYLLKAADHAGGMAADAEALELYERSLDAIEKSTRGQMTGLQRAELEFKIGEALYRSGKQEQAVDYLRQALHRLGVAFPLDRKHIKAATLRELVRCVPALLMHGPRAEAPPDRDLSPENRLQFRIFETLSFTDYFSQPQRVLLDMLLGFRAVKAKPRSREYVVTMGGLGLAFNLLGIRWLSARCNARAFRFAGEIDDQSALASCYLFQGLEQEHDGMSDQSVDTLRRSVDLYLAAGDLRRWKTALKGLLILLRNRGDRSWIGLNNQILQLFTEMQDPHSEAWAGSGRGHEEMMKGDYAAAAEVFARISRVYEQVPDYRTLAQSLCEWGRCEFHLGHVNEALSLVRRGAGLVAEHEMRGFNATEPIMTAAEVLLMAAEGSAGPTREALLQEARKACAVADRHAKRTRDCGAAESIRLRAMLARLEDRPEEAERLLLKAARVAESLGAKPVLAQVHLDLGRRFGHIEHLRRAYALFDEIGATHLRAEAAAAATP